METRATDIIRDKEIIWKYRKAGIIYISFGIETADQTALDKMRKEMVLEEIKQVFDILREQEIVSEASFMLGYPDETSASIKKTMHLAQQYNPDIANFLRSPPGRMQTGTMTSNALFGSTIMGNTTWLILSLSHTK